MIELLLLADVNFPEHKLYFVCPQDPSLDNTDRKSRTNDSPATLIVPPDNDQIFIRLRKEPLFDV